MKKVTTSMYFLRELGIYDEEVTVEFTDEQWQSILDRRDATVGLVQEYRNLQKRAAGGAKRSARITAEGYEQSLAIINEVVGKVTE